MTFKHTRIILAIVALVATAMASQAQFRWAATANVNIQGFNLKQKNIVTTSKTVGYGAGVLGEVIFPGIGVGIDLGLMYNQTGGKIDLGAKKIWASEGYGNEQLIIHNILIPLHLRLKYTRLNGFEEYVAPFVYAGPEFQLQVGHNKCNAIRFSGGDLAIGFGAGAEIMKNWQVSVSYSMGLTYAMKTRLLENFSARCNYWSVRVCRFF